MTITKLILIPISIGISFIEMFIIYMPGISGIYLRRIYFFNKFKACGKGLVVHMGVIIESPGLISVGDNVTIDRYCSISTGKKVIGTISKDINNNFEFEQGEIVIGNDVHLAPYTLLAGHGGIYLGNNVVLSSGCKLYSLSNLAYDPLDRKRIVSIMPYSQANFLLSPIVLGDNVWLGLNTIVMPGVTIEKNSFSTSNSLVMENFSENSYLSGQPAIKIRNRFL